MSQSLSIRAMSFDFMFGINTMIRSVSQSLSIRAMSFDIKGASLKMEALKVSIPFDQGNVFRQIITGVEYIKKWKVSIPFDQGNVFRQHYSYMLKSIKMVSIPFDQGNVFRLQRYAGGRNHAAFQTYFPIFLEG